MRSSNLQLTVHRHQWGDVPPPTYGSTAVKVSDRWMLLFGGKLHSGGALNTTYVAKRRVSLSSRGPSHLLDLTTFEWRLLSPKGVHLSVCLLRTHLPRHAASGAIRALMRIPLAERNHRDDDRVWRL